MSEAVQNAELVQTNAGLRAEVQGLGAGVSSVFSSIQGDDFESRKKVVSAVTDSLPIREHLGEVINLKDVVVQVVAMENEQTKQLEDQPRVILIDDAGNSYHAISGVILKDVQNLMGILGQPHTWPEPVPIAVKEQQSNGKRRFMTLTLV